MEWKYTALRVPQDKRFKAKGYTRSSLLLSTTICDQELARLAVKRHGKFKFSTHDSAHHVQLVIAF